MECQFDLAVDHATDNEVNELIGGFGHSHSEIARVREHYRTVLAHGNPHLRQTHSNYNKLK
jgi:hypothetical protein